MMPGESSLSKGYKRTKVGVIPEEWHEGTVSDLFRVVTGTTPSTSSPEYWEDGTLLWITPTDLSTNNGQIYIFNCERKITDAAVRDYNLHRLPVGSIIVSTRAPVGYVALNRNVAYINQGCKGLIPKETVSGAEVYYSYYLKSRTSELTRMSGGSTFKELSKQSLESFPMPIPQNNECRRIATILSTVDAAIAATDEVITKTEELKRGLMQDLLSKGVDEDGRVRSEETHEFYDIQGMRVPVEWGVTKLEKAIRIYDCKHYTPHYVENGYPIIRPQNVSGGYLDLASSNFVSDEDYKILTEKHQPHYGDIIYSRNASMGIAVYVDTHEQFCIGQDMVVMTKSSSNPHFVYYCLQSEIVANQIKRLSSGSTFHRINLKNIRKMIIPNPSTDEQDSIVRTLSTIDARAKSERIYRTRLLTLKKGLMQDLLTGRKRVPLNGAGGMPGPGSQNVTACAPPPEGRP
jgi:type I restriction enzyme S subunit